MTKRIAIINDLEDKISLITSKDTEQSAQNLNTVSNAVNKFLRRNTVGLRLFGFGGKSRYRRLAIDRRPRLAKLANIKIDRSARDKSAMQISQLAGVLADPLRRLNRRAARYHACHDAITELLCSLFDCDVLGEFSLCFIIFMRKAARGEMPATVDDDPC